MKSVLVQQSWLAASNLLLGLVLWIPISRRFGEVGVEGLVTAAVLCLAPGLVLLVIQSVWSAGGLAGFGALAGGVIRTLFALVGFLAIRRFHPEMPLVMFGSLLSVFYLVSLGVETWMIVGSLDKSRSA